MSGHLLSQAAAELQVAAELLKIAEEDQTGKPVVPTTRAARGVTLQDAIKDLESSMAKPVTAGLPVEFRVTRAIPPVDPEGAKKGLPEAATTTAGAITQQVVEAGGDLAYNLVFNTEWGAVIQSTGLISSDVANLLEKIKEGVGGSLKPHC